MTQRFASYRPQRVNMRHAATYTANGGTAPHIAAFEYITPQALDADGILAAQSIDSAGETSTFAAAYTATETQMTRYGRNVTVAASGVATSAVTVRGRDYLGQPMLETLTLSGASTVQGVRAFRYIDLVTWAATSSTTINVGWGNYLGLPYKCFSMVDEVKNSSFAANAGTFVAGLPSTSPANATNTDVRGLYLPITVIPNSSNTFRIRCVVDTSNLFGNAHYYLAP